MVLGKPEEDIPEINLYQKRKVCFIVSDNGDALFVELSPQHKRKNQAQSTEGFGFRTGVITDSGAQFAQENYSNHDRAKPLSKSDELRKIYDESPLEREIRQPSISEYRIFLIVDALSKLNARDFRVLCLKCLEDDKVERDKIRRISDAFFKAEELCEYFDSSNRGLNILVEHIRRFNKMLHRKIEEKHREEGNKAK